MRLTARPESLLEFLALAAGEAPRPLIDTHLALIAARAVMAGSTLGVFEALREGPRPLAELVALLKTAERPLEQLTRALVSLGYLSARNGKLAVPRALRKWLLSDSEENLAAKLLFQEQEWLWMASLEPFVKTGQPVRIHEQMSAGSWSRYQAAMAALARAGAPALTRKIPVPPGATRMLDVGGSHGHHAAALLRAHPALVAEIAELPSALPHAEALGRAHGLGARLCYRGLDARRDSFGTAEYDLVFAANLVHHFEPAEAESLFRRAATALKPGGTLAIFEFERQDGPPRQGDAAGALVGLYFALTSASGTFSQRELAELTRSAGLQPLPPKRLVRHPGMVLQLGRKASKRRRG